MVKLGLNESIGVSVCLIAVGTQGEVPHSHLIMVSCPSSPCGGGAMINSDMAIF